MFKRNQGLIVFFSTMTIFSITVDRAVHYFNQTTLTSGKIEEIKGIFVNTPTYVALAYHDKNGFQVIRFEAERVVFKEDLSACEKPWARYHGTIGYSGTTHYTYLEIHIRSAEEDIHGKFSAAKVKNLKKE